MGHSLPGSSVHEILQARILEWVALPSLRGPSQLRDQTHWSLMSPALASGFFTTSTTWETPDRVICVHNTQSCYNYCSAMKGASSRAKPGHRGWAGRDGKNLSAWWRHWGKWLNYAWSLLKLGHPIMWNNKFRHCLSQSQGILFLEAKSTDLIKCKSSDLGE